MEKIKIEPGTFLYPMPTTLVGANVGGKPNYSAIAYIGIVNQDPPAVSIASNMSHYTNIGIRENRTFSVNIPSTGMVEITDYCGTKSGKNVDKSGLFDTFYGELETAPMIRECPLCFECKVIQTVVITTMEAFIGEIVAVYTEEKYLTDGLPDITKIDPIIFAMHENNYYRLGEFLEKAYSVGRNFKPPE